MSEFSLDTFALRLIADTLFFDAEYGALGNLSLVDPEKACECFVASYVPEDESFVIEEATSWEDFSPETDDEIGYALAVESKEYGLYDTPEEAAQELFALAKKRHLMPSVTLLFEEEDLE